MTTMSRALPLADLVARVWGEYAITQRDLITIPMIRVPSVRMPVPIM